MQWAREAETTTAVPVLHGVWLWCTSTKSPRRYNLSSLFIEQLSLSYNKVGDRLDCLSDEVFNRKALFQIFWSSGVL